jgi:hypothetical protein
MWRRAAVSVGLTALVATGLSACGGGAPTLPPGDRVASRPVLEGSTATVQLPTGSLKLVVTDPRDELTDREAEPHRAPDGGSFVGVAWFFEPPEAADASVLSYVLDDEPPAATVTLVADGERYRLGSPYDRRHEVGDESRTTSWWVAVDGPADTLEVEVEYDGLTQTVDVAGGEVDPGLAEPLYDPAPFSAGESPCETVEPSGSFPRVDYDAYTCTVEVLGLSPYVEGAGWAETGRSFAVVSVVSGLFGPMRWRPEEDSDAVTYDDETRESFTITVDGRPVAATLSDGPEADGGAGSTLVAVEVPADGTANLELAARYRSGPVDRANGVDGYPQRVEASFTRTVPLVY